MPNEEGRFNPFRLRKNTPSEAGITRETALKGITLRGLKRLHNRVHELVRQGWFKDGVNINGTRIEGVTVVAQLTTEMLVNGWGAQCSACVKT